MKNLLSRNGKCKINGKRIKQQEAARLKKKIQFKECQRLKQEQIKKNVDNISILDAKHKELTAENKSFDGDIAMKRKKFKIITKLYRKRFMKK